MRRWSTSEYLGIGLAALVAGMGLIILLGVWLITQRDAALLTGVENWTKWDKALSLWAYGALLFLFLLLSVIALWWWNAIGRTLLSLRDKIRGILWESRKDITPPPSLPAEAESLWKAFEELEAFLQFLEEITTGKRKSLPPQATEWSPLLRDLAINLTNHITLTAQRSSLNENLLNQGIEILRRSQKHAQIASYLSEVAPIFLQSIGASMG
ncbi:MAG: hypothetical protein RMJ66_03655, partial [Bacteroidia bacterium]|nr:hypothetical protein [Bacteroidia bacterium]MDW8134143.1 hypothetical protein [Bacteroidia bacterium]